MKTRKTATMIVLVMLVITAMLHQTLVSKILMEMGLGTRVMTTKMETVRNLE